MKRFLSSLLLPLFALLLPHAVLAAGPRVYISEVAWAGSSLSTADEWLELANGGDASADVSGWHIEGAATGGTALIIPTGSIIAPGATFLIANYGADDPKSTLVTAPQWVTTAVSLPNDKLTLVLRDASGAIIDAAGASGEVPPSGTTGAVKASMERAEADIVGTDPSAWRTATASIGFDVGVTDLGTPGTSPIMTEVPAVPPMPEAVSVAATTESIQTPAIRLTPTAVRLSEVMPSPPTGDKEWIELVNRGDIGELLDGWTLEDGKTEIARLSGLIQPWGRMIISGFGSHLNNDGDLVVLKNARGLVVDAVAYGSWEKGPYASAPGIPHRGQSVARVEQSETWRVSDEPTPGESNIAPDDAAEPAETKEVAPAVPVKAAVQTSIKTFSATTTLSVVASATGTAHAFIATVATMEKKLPAKKATKPKAPAKSRYKGARYEATVAVPLGVYGKTRMIVQILPAGSQSDGVLRELRLTKAPADAPSAGEHIAFVAQEKSDAGHSYLAANVNSLEALDDTADEPVFTPTQAWPTATGPVELSATVVSADQYAVTAHAGDRDGLIDLPTALKLSLKPGDQISVRGFVAPDGDKPTLFLAAVDALNILARAADASAPQNGFRLPPWATASITASALGVGVLAYLRNERLKRLSLVRREDDLPLEE